MKYDVQIDLSKLPLQTRNSIMRLVNNLRCYYKLENQVLYVDFKTASKIFKSLEENEFN